MVKRVHRIYERRLFNVITGKRLQMGFIQQERPVQSLL